MTVFVFQSFAFAGATSGSTFAVNSLGAYNDHQPMTRTMACGNFMESGWKTKIPAANYDFRQTKKIEVEKSTIEKIGLPK